MSRVRVDLARLDDLVRQMQHVVEQLERVRVEVDARLRDTHVDWTGRAAATQADAHARWSSGAAELQEALATLRAIAATAHGNYEAALHANRRMWSL